MQPGDTVKLTGKTKHGKNRVREQGAVWIVVKVKSGMLFCEDKEKEFALLRKEDNPGEFLAMGCPERRQKLFSRGIK